MSSTKLWILYFLSTTHSTGLWKHKRPGKLGWRKTEGETEGWMAISHICCLNYSQESGQRPIHSSTLNFWGLSGGQIGLVWKKSLQKSLHCPWKKLGIILLQDECKERVSLCYNDSICGFPPTAFFLRGLSGLLAIITNKPCTELYSREHNTQSLSSWNCQWQHQIQGLSTDKWLTNFSN